MPLLHSDESRGNIVEIGFQLVLQQEVDQTINSNQVEVKEKINPAE